MARAKVKSAVASKVKTRGKTFYKDRWTILTDKEEIEYFLKNSSFKVLEVAVEELAKPPVPKDDFLKFDEPVVEQHKYHGLMAMKKAELQEIAYDMGALVPDDALKRELVQAILDKQAAVDEIPS